MRFKLTLSLEKNEGGNALPLSCQYEMFSSLLGILSQSNRAYSQWLHDNGFTLGKKTFKLFTFSRFLIPNYRINKIDKTIIIDCPTIYLYLSFLPERSTEEFIRGIFINRSFDLGDYRHRVHLTIDNIELQAEPDFTNELRFETLSPINLSVRNDESPHPQYLSLDDPAAGELIMNGLINRYIAFYGQEYTGDRAYHFQVLTQPKPVLITIKAHTPEETKVRGYLCRFRMKADPRLMKIMYDAGCGEKGSQGFGMVKVV